MAKQFKAFTYNKVKYLAIFDEYENVHILEENGQNHGKFKSIDSFKSYRQLGDTCLGHAKLSLTPISQNP